MSGGAMPTVLLPSKVTLKSAQPTRVSSAYSLKRQARTRGAQRWAISMSWQAMPRAVFTQFYAFFLSQRGQADPFTTLLPGYTVPQGTWPGTVLVDGASQTGRVLNLKGFTPSQAGAAKAGDILTLAGQTKVYMVTADAASDGAGKMALAIEPALQASPSDGAAVTSSNVVFTVALASDSLDGNISPGMLHTIDVDLVEVF